MMISVDFLFIKKTQKPRENWSSQHLLEDTLKSYATE